MKALEHQTGAAVDVHAPEYRWSGHAAARRREQRDALALDLRVQRGRPRQTQDAALIQGVDLRLASRPDQA